MPTTYTDQFYQIDPAAPPAQGTVLTPVTLNLVDQNSNGTITSNGNNGDSLDGSDITAVWPGDTITVIRNGQPQTITGTTFYLADGRRFFTPTDGTVLQTGTFDSSTFVTTQGAMPVSALGPPCFTPGTLVRVPGGEVAIESLEVGDLVETMDHGAQPLRWIGRRTVAATGNFAPVRIAAGTLGNARDLLVSPQHRMLVAGPEVEICFAEPAILVAAKHLVGMEGVTEAPMPQVDYIHLLFDRHEIIFAEGAPSESFHPDSWMLDEDPALLAEVAAIFPDIADRDAAVAARRVLTAREARLLAA